MGVPAGQRPAEPGARPRRPLIWTVAISCLVVAGILASVLAAGAIAANQEDQARRSFQRSSAKVASTLQLALQREDDAVVDAGGLVADPTLTRGSFEHWAKAAQVLDRYPEMGGLAVLKLVRDTDLPAFASQAEAAPTAPLGPTGTFQLDPPGQRPTYCLVAAGISVPSVDTAPVGFDYCANPLVKAPLFVSRDNGRGVYLPYRTTGKAWLAIQTPIYRGGETPGTVEERQAAFAGWVVTQLDPTVLLQRAVRDEPGMSVSLVYREYGSNFSFRYGASQADEEVATVDLGDGWSVHTSGAIESGGVLDGDPLLLLLSGITVSVLLGLLLYVLGTGRERARRQLEERTRELHHQALHDALTGLPNRALVLDRAEQMLERNRRSQTTGAALFLDLDDFKNVNDTLGHGAGDHLLVAVSARLATALRGGDTIGRMGGDEFVVLLDGSASDVAPDLVAERLLDVLSQPFDLPESRLPITVNVSIGIATGDRPDAGALLRDADVALYEAKSAGKNRYAIFDPVMHSDVSRRSDLEFDLRSALAAGQYRVMYQPIYRLDDLTLVGVEALLRWDHPTRGVIGPDEFIPILEQIGHIGDVGRWVLHQACHQTAAWHGRGESLDVSVNVSARQLEHDYIVDDVREALLFSGLPASALIVEVTETALMRNVEEVGDRLRAIKKLGVRIAIDDFGTGYSSLAYLRQFPVDCLKIDRSFTSGVDSSPESEALVDTLVQLGKKLGLCTLAEGVETADEMDTLREAKVDQAQGFLMAHPLDPQTLETQLLEPRRTPAPRQAS